MTDNLGYATWVLGVSTYFDIIFDINFNKG